MKINTFIWMSQTNNKPFVSLITECKIYIYKCISLHTFIPRKEFKPTIYYLIVPRPYAPSTVLPLCSALIFQSKCQCKTDYFIVLIPLSLLLIAQYRSTGMKGNWTIFPYPRLLHFNPPNSQILLPIERRNFPPHLLLGMVFHSS